MFKKGLFFKGTEYHGENPVFGDIGPREHTTVREEDPDYEGGDRCDGRKPLERIPG